MQPDLYSWICGTCSQAGVSEHPYLHLILARHNLLKPECPGPQVHIAAVERQKAAAA